ncbi:MAG: zinc ribbon domain-containing protein [Myxococcales bacterium]|nr:zinc ribbon domain-containing protein [Myxococcales bacterium]MBK7198878.1 zinc ribbon domain-containing protein [Myxococcales bacterium]
MFCPGCGAANVDGAKFCGSCGFRLDPTPVPGPAPAPTSAASATTPTVVRMPQAIEPSAASLAPVRSGRGGRLGIVLGVDAALVIAGVVLWTRPPGAAAPAKVAAVEPGGGGTDGGTPPTTFVDPGSGSPRGGHGGAAGGGGGGGGGTGSAATPGGGGSGSGSGAGTGSGSGPAVGGVDARSLDDRLTDAPAAPLAEVDASGAIAPPPDAAEAAAPEVDAAGDPPPPGEVDAGADDEVSAAVIQSQFARLGVTSESRFSRCYQSATKALPDDQPLVGKLDISLAVMPTGRTENVRVDVNTTGSQTLANCIVGVIGSWQFSPHDGAGPLQFSKSIDFKPQ